MSNKIKVYEYDFGDTNIIDRRLETILELIKSNLEALKPGDEWEYVVTCKEMTQKEYDNLPEWQ